MNEIFEKIYNENNTGTEENILFEKVYTEAKMLNEMNPKLRKILGSAALAAALGMGTVGCSTPNDDYSEPPAIEQPANPDNPGETEDTGFEDSEEAETPETPSDPEDVVTFETLGVADYAASLANVVKDPTTYRQILSLGSQFDEYIYKVEELGFVPLEVNSKTNQYEDGQTYIRYINPSTLKIFYVPEDMESYFDTAIAAYKAAHAE